ncbi:MAG: anti-sigma-factor antagonist [Solirubrobacterales bacterium]|nr:anti-sigma-factor antagonist [Solirubrobacterales bacterium]
MPISSHRRLSHSAARRTRRPRLQVQELADGTLHRLILTGELDIVSCTDLEAGIFSLCKRGIRWLVLDMSRVTFMDLCGLRMVLFARELCEWQGCEFGLIPGPGSVQRVFELTNLLDVPAAPSQVARRCSAGPLQPS